MLVKNTQGKWPTRREGVASGLKITNLNPQTIKIYNSGRRTGVKSDQVDTKLHHQCSLPFMHMGSYCFVSNALWQKFLVLTKFRKNRRRLYRYLPLYKYENTVDNEKVCNEIYHCDIKSHKKRQGTL